MAATLISLVSFFTLFIPSFLGAESFNDPEEIVSSIGLKFRLVPSGTFMMGAGPDFQGESLYEKPAREVTISKPFYISATEVTQSQFTAVMGFNPSRFKGNDHPVDSVSYEDALAFVEKLNRKENVDSYKLPTEAEWEYAARAGSQDNYCFGNDAEKLKEYAWYDETVQKGSTHPVATKKPNAWGIYDMHGNLFEWTEDWFGEDYYKVGPKKDPKGPTTGTLRSLRGGSWGNDYWFCQVAARNMEAPTTKSMITGLRIKKEID
jgi:formylglycine-generating enzyme required for sulfatase activity